MERPGSPRRAAVAEAQDSCSYDAPSNGNPDPLPPGSLDIPPNNAARNEPFGRAGLGRAATP